MRKGTTVTVGRVNTQATVDDARPTIGASRALADAGSTPLAGGASVRPDPVTGDPVGASVRPDPVTGDPGGDAILTVSNLSVEYRSRGRIIPAVRGVSFDIRHGEVFGLVGESGSGKSSICSAVMRLLPSAATSRADSMMFDGVDLVRQSDRAMRRIRGTRLALVPQRPMTSLSPTTPIGRQLRWHLGKRIDAPEVREMLITLGLRTVLDRSQALPGTFSGGQLQRLLILISALTHGPSLLLADEPTTTLDATVQAQVLRLLLQARQRVGAGILYVSHDLAVVTQISDRVGVIYGGKLVEVAPVRQLVSAPRHPYTRALLASMPSSWRQDQVPTAIRGSAFGANRLPGCPFAPRCPRADDVCHRVMPGEDFQHDGLSMVRCHHADGAR